MSSHLCSKAPRPFYRWPFSTISWASLNPGWNRRGKAGTPATQGFAALFSASLAVLTLKQKAQKSNCNLSLVWMCVPSLQLCLIFCDPIDCSPPGSSIQGILQARILEWVAMPSSRGSSPPPGIECTPPVSPALQADSLTLSHLGSPTSPLPCKYRELG